MTSSELNEWLSSGSLLGFISKMIFVINARMHLCHYFWLEVVHFASFCFASSIASMIGLTPNSYARRIRSAENPLALETFC